MFPASFWLGSSPDAAAGSRAPCAQLRRPPGPFHVATLVLLVGGTGVASEKERNEGLNQGPPNFLLKAQILNILDPAGQEAK